MDLSINVLIVLCTIGAVAYYFFAEGVGNMLVHGAECFKYFTIESNVLAAITCVIYIVFNIIKIKKPDYIVPTWALILKFVGTISVSVTFVMVVFVIAPGYAVIYDASYFDNFSS